jgi:hypothetical protein
MDCPDPYHAAFIFHSQSFGNRQGVIIAVPHINIFAAQLDGNLARMLSIQAEGEGRHAVFDAARVAQAVERQTADAFQHIQQLRLRRYS